MYICSKKPVHCNILSIYHQVFTVPEEYKSIRNFVLKSTNTSSEGRGFFLPIILSSSHLASRCSYRMICTISRSAMLHSLVGGFNPLKHISQLGWWNTQYMEKKCSKPPTSSAIWKIQKHHHVMVWPFGTWVYVMPCFSMVSWSYLRHLFNKGSEECKPTRRAAGRISASWRWCASSCEGSRTHPDPEFLGGPIKTKVSCRFSSETNNVSSFVQVEINHRSSWFILAEELAKSGHTMKHDTTSSGWTCSAPAEAKLRHFNWWIPVVLCDTIMPLFSTDT